MSLGTRFFGGGSAAIIDTGEDEFSKRVDFVKKEVKRTRTVDFEAEFHGDTETHWSKIYEEDFGFLPGSKITFKMLEEARLSYFEIMIFKKKLCPDKHRKKSKIGNLSPKGPQLHMGEPCIDLHTFDKVHRRGFGSLSATFRKNFMPHLDRPMGERHRLGKYDLTSQIYDLMSHEEDFKSFLGPNNKITEDDVAEVVERGNYCDDGQNGTVAFGAVG